MDWTDILLQLGILSTFILFGVAVIAIKFLPSEKADGKEADDNNDDER